MNPPSPNQFTNHNELLEYIHAFSETQEYAVTTKRSRSDINGEIKNITLGCDRSGVYRNRLNLTDGSRHRKTASRLLNCPFELFGTKHNNVWHLEIRNFEHNHEAFTDMLGHPVARRLNVEQKELVWRMAAAGSCPCQILSTICQSDSSSKAISRTVYNALYSIRQERLDGHTPVQALLDELQESDFEFEYQCDDQNHITHLFFAHRISIALTHTYPTALLIDCTYKTNRYKMPLMNVVSMSSFNMTFYSCFAFLSDETELDYEWVLICILKIFNNMSHPNVIVTDQEFALMKAIKKVFPNTQHILCIWHINKNILAKCKRYFTTDENWTEFIRMWQVVIGSVTEQDFEIQWNEFLKSYSNKPEVLKYLQETWLPYKKHFISAYTNRHLHLSDLELVFHKIILQVESQEREIRATISYQRMKVQHMHQIPLFEPILYRVSFFVLNKIHEELIKVLNAILDSSLKPCTGIQGHRIEFLEPTYLVNNNQSDLQPLLQSLIQVYQFWPLHQQVAIYSQLEELVNTPPIVLEDPVISRPRGRPVGAKNKNKRSTHRDLSEFEHTEKHSRQC
ncbi:23275_t:CDS:2, partial [Cetraspora pellucida]